MKSLQEEAKDGLIFLFQQTAISFVLWMLMLLITQGRPSEKVITATVILNVGMVAYLEAKRVRSN